eukprot:Gregarina_sp_Poly_1__4279@NODE_232_length_11105_cov_98_544211_g205_i0_p3_GENE_NODE_232_length_11105_cov_98_544211_g205_i0NODE_232_length_11105_cov_98_544211_g205_i0_p3_ORF_typecomplete_len313_score18_68CathepsinC_exc/PF08773_11/7_9e21_NODE_232_length_11105_cov_98_544211_g205_i028483786
MKHYFPSVIVCLDAVVRGDLPVHATIPQVSNSWEFVLVPVFDRASSDHCSMLSTCGSGLPNRNIQNLDPDFNGNYLRWLKSSLRSNTTKIDKRTAHTIRLINSSPWKSLRLELTLNRVSLALMPNVKLHRANWKGLKVADEKGRAIGVWTMIYDEALEVRLKSGLVLTAILKYTRDSDDPDCQRLSVKEGAPEDPERQDSCYKTNPRETLLGWFQQNDGSRTIFGCAHGKQYRGSKRAVSENHSDSDEYKVEPEVLKSILKQKEKRKPPLFAPRVLGPRTTGSHTASLDSEIEMPLPAYCGWEPHIPCSIPS